MPLTRRDERLVEYLAIVSLVEIGKDGTACSSRLVCRLPEKEHALSKWPVAADMFCVVPYDLSQLEKDEKVSWDGLWKYFYAFALTDETGKHAFGSCLPFEKNHVVCIISHWPYFGLYKEFLLRLFRALRNPSVARESIAIGIQEFVYTTRLPAPGCTLKIPFPNRLQSRRKNLYHRAPETSIPHVDDECFVTLLDCLSVKNVVTIFAGLLMEQRVLIHSEEICKLTMCAEALTSLLYPLCWPHVYIPFLPSKMIEYLESPMPFIIGVHTSAFDNTHSLETLASCLLVHLDSDKVVTPIDVTLPGEQSEQEWLQRHCTNVNHANGTERYLPDLPAAVRDRLISRLHLALQAGIETKAFKSGSLERSSFEDKCSDEGSMPPPPPPPSYGRPSPPPGEPPASPSNGPSHNGTMDKESSNQTNAWVDGHEDIHAREECFIHERERSKSFNIVAQVLPGQLLSELLLPEICACPDSMGHKLNMNENHCEGCMEVFDRLGHETSSRVEAKYFALSERNEEEIVLLFGSGRLPMKLRPWVSQGLGELSAELIELTGIEEVFAGGGSGILSKLVLVSVNGVSTMNMSFEQTVCAISLAARPMKLRFMCEDALESSWNGIDMYRSAFVVTMVELLGGYSKFLVDRKVEGKSGAVKRNSVSTKMSGSWAGWFARTKKTENGGERSIFDIKAFLREMPKSHIGFMECLCASQAFDVFIEDCIMSRIALRNRSINEEGSMENLSQAWKEDTAAAFDAEIGTFNRCVQIHQRADNAKDDRAWMEIGRLLSRNPVVTAEHAISLARRFRALSLRRRCSTQTQLEHEPYNDSDKESCGTQTEVDSEDGSSEDNDHTQPHNEEEETKDDDDDEHDAAKTHPREQPKVKLSHMSSEDMALERFTRHLFAIAATDDANASAGFARKQMTMRVDVKPGSADCEDHPWNKKRKQHKPKLPTSPTWTRRQSVNYHPVGYEA